jgi:hypothetical protein
LQRLAIVDERLQQSADLVDRIAGGTNLGRWRQSLQPPASAWWWMLDQRVATTGPRVLIVGAIAGVLLSASVGIIADVSSHWIAGHPDILSSLFTVLPAALTLITGGTLTRLGGDFLVRRGLPHRWLSVVNLLLATAVLLLALGIKTTEPRIAQLYAGWGEWAQATLPNEAIEDFQRAISLSPNEAVYHFDLAQSLVGIGDDKGAVTEYLTAYRLDPRAIGNLIDLAFEYDYQGDYVNGLNYAEAGFSVLGGDAACAGSASMDDPMTCYMLLVDRGWAYLGLNDLRLAEADLRNALGREKNHGIAGHCLLAQVMAARNVSDVANREWQTCVTDRSILKIQGEGWDPRWLAVATERVFATPKPEGS